MEGPLPSILTSNVEFTEIHLKIASKLKSIVTILASIALVGEHIFQVLGQYLKFVITLASIEQVNTP